MWFAFTLYISQVNYTFSPVGLCSEQSHEWRSMLQLDRNDRGWTENKPRKKNKHGSLSLKTLNTITFLRVFSGSRCKGPNIEETQSSRFIHCSLLHAQRRWHMKSKKAPVSCSLDWRQSVIKKRTEIFSKRGSRSGCFFRTKGPNEWGKQTVVYWKQTKSGRCEHMNPTQKDANSWRLFWIISGLEI